MRGRCDEDVEGNINNVCQRFQRSNNEFRVQTAAQLQKGSDPNGIEAEQEKYAQWMQWRGVLVQDRAKNPDARNIKQYMNEIEFVQILRDDGEHGSRPSILYRKDSWEENIVEMDVTARSQLDFKYEGRLNK